MTARDGTPTAVYVGATTDRRDLEARLDDVAVLPARDALDALKRLDGTDCVVSVADPPGMDLRAFVERIRDAEPSLPVIVVGEPDAPADAVEYAPAGSGRALAEDVRLAIARRRADRALGDHRSIKGLLVEVARSAATAETRAAAERTVHERLAASDHYRTALIGTYDADRDALRLRIPMRGEVDADAVAGVDSDAVRRAAGGELAVARPGSTAGAAVPLAAGDVLALSTGRRDAFDGSERDRLEAVGAAVARASAGRGAEAFVRSLRRAVNEAVEHLERARWADGADGVDRVERALDRVEAELELVEGNGAGELVLRDFSDAARAAWDGVDPEAALVVEGSVPVFANHALLEGAFAALFETALAHATPGAVVRIGPCSDGLYVENEDPHADRADPDVPEDARRIAAAHGWEVAARAPDGGTIRFEITGVRTGAQRHGFRWAREE